MEVNSTRAKRYKRLAETQSFDRKDGCAGGLNIARRTREKEKRRAKVDCDRAVLAIFEKVLPWSERKVN